MLSTPICGRARLETHVSATTNETATMGISVTAHATTHTKGNYTQLIASTAYESFGIFIQLAGLQTVASTNQRGLVDIAIGGAGVEVDLIPNLLCGNVADMGAAAGSGGACYYFPIYIPAGVRVAARCQASTTVDIINVAVRLFQFMIGPGDWVGSRVTAYGVNTAASNGTSHTPSQNAYATATQLIASTTNPIKYMQLGFDLLADTTGATSNYLARIGYGAGPTYLASELPVQESTTIESVGFVSANFILSHMRFNLPAAQSLHISAMRAAATPEARGFAVYGVD